MGKETPAAPAPVDYNAQAQAQGIANVEAARTGAALNRVNQFTPYGSLVYTPGENPDQWEATMTLSPEQQQLLDKTSTGQLQLADAANAGLGRVQQAFGSNFDTSGMPSRVTSVGPSNYQRNLDFSGLSDVPQGDAYEAQRQEVQDALYRRATSTLDPQFSQEEEALRSRLINSGIAPGTEAYSQALGDFNRNKMSAYGDARDRAITAGGAEQSRMTADNLAGRQQMLAQIMAGGEFSNQAEAQRFADSIAGANFQNQQRGASIDEMAFLRSLPLNEYNALITGSQVTNPSFANTPNAASPAPAPVFAGAQAQQQDALDLYNQQIATNNQNAQAGIGAAATIAAAIF